MSCCEHGRLCHRYNTTTRKNDGRCLSRECDCQGFNQEDGAP